MKKPTKSDWFAKASVIYLVNKMHWLYMSDAEELCECLGLWKKYKGSLLKEFLSAVNDVSYSDECYIQFCLEKAGL